ncbi:MAG: hypothetical protein WAO35_06720 [Terriglobia bacterium]
MFAMIDEAPARSEYRKLNIVKTAAETVAIAVLGVAVFLLATLAAMGAVLLFFAFAPHAIS